MKAEHIALLAFVGDESAFSRRSLAHALQALPTQAVEPLLSEVLEHLGDGEFVEKGSPLLYQFLEEAQDEERAREYLRIIEEYTGRGIRILTYWDDDFPERLRHIDAPPMLLYIRGSAFPGDSPIAIVGTREASSKGLDLARLFAQRLAGRGHTILGGLARGIDSAAHHGALESGGTTIAVLAGHVDHIYPKQNRSLAETIVDHGALVSEITSLVRVRPGRFVARNRITSGLADAVVVVESMKRGGTLHQAKFAIAQGRPTYAVDHGTFERRETEEGFNHLTGIGAIAIEAPEDLPFYL